MRNPQVQLRYQLYLRVHQLHAYLWNEHQLNNVMSLQSVIVMWSQLTTLVDSNEGLTCANCPSQGCHKSPESEWVSVWMWEILSVLLFRLGTPANSSVALARSCDILDWVTLILQVEHFLLWSLSFVWEITWLDYVCIWVKFLICGPLHNVSSSFFLCGPVPNDPHPGRACSPVVGDHSHRWWTNGNMHQLEAGFPNSELSQSLSLQWIMI